VWCSVIQLSSKFPRIPPGLIWMLASTIVLHSRPWCRSALRGHPVPALTDNWTHGASSRHTIAPISHTRPSPCSRSYYSFPVPLRVGGRVGLSTQWVSNLLKVACSGPGVSRTCNLSVTSPILYHWTTAFRHTVCYSSSAVTMAVSCIVETKQDIGRKTTIFHTHRPLNLHDHSILSSFFFKNFNTNCPSHISMLCARNYCNLFSLIDYLPSVMLTIDHSERFSICRNCTQMASIYISW